MKHEQAFAGDSDFKFAHPNSADRFDIIVIKADKLFEFFFAARVACGIDKGAGFNGCVGTEKIKNPHPAAGVRIKTTKQNFFDERFARAIVTRAEHFGESLYWHGELLKFFRREVNRSEGLEFQLQPVPRRLKAKL